jgi:hypothetical protein
MSSQLDRLVPVLDGTNYREWSVMMQSYLQMQELWDVVGGRTRMPTQPTPAATDAPQAARDAYAAAHAVYQTEYATWYQLDSRAMGALTLRLAPQLRHYRTPNITVRALWVNLERAFGAPSMSAIFSDFKVVMGIKLSGGNPVPEIERMAELFGRLASNNLPVAEPFPGLILLAALPPKWDSVAQLFMQRTNLQQQLTFANVRAAITQEYERANRPVDRSANKLSAVKRKGPDPSYQHQQPRHQQQQQPGPSRQQQPQQSQQAPRKRRGGKQEKAKKERRNKQRSDVDRYHDHSHFASSAHVEAVVEPSKAPTYINASQPSRAAPLHSTVASFGKNGIEYRKVPLATAAEKPKATLSASHWPTLNEARELCDSLAIPKTAKNLKPLETPRVSAPIKPTADPFLSMKKAQKAVSKMLDKDAAASTSKAPLIQRMNSPPSIMPSFDWATDENYEESYPYGMEDLSLRIASRDPSVSLGEEVDDPYNFDESDSDSDAPRRVGGNPYLRMDVDEDIADAAGLPAKGKGKQRERQVALHSCNNLLLTTPQCTLRSTSTAEANEEPLGSVVVDYRCALQALVISINKIELHTQSCEKCKRKIHDQKAWILDSGASQHFTSTLLHHHLLTSVFPFQLRVEPTRGGSVPIRQENIP